MYLHAKNGTKSTSKELTILLTDWVSDIGFLGTRNQPKECVSLRQVWTRIFFLLCQSHKIFDDFKKWQRVLKYSAKREEKLCSSSLKSISSVMALPKLEIQVLVTQWSITKHYRHERCISLQVTKTLQVSKSCTYALIWWLVWSVYWKYLAGLIKS